MDFMGKDWDKAVPSVEQWEHCYRVLKDGAFMFVQSAPRLDLLGEMERRIRDAGFITSFTPIFWTFATGFPKAQNVAMAIDRAACKLQLTDKLGRKPTFKEFQTAWKTFREREHDPKSELAQNFDGFYGGFQPKPAVEVIIVAMKPMTEKTYIAQIEANGKGGVWFDKGRIPIKESGEDKRLGGKGDWSTKKAAENIYNGGYAGERVTSHEDGRFPANLFTQDGMLEDWSKYFDLDAWFHEMIKTLPLEHQRVFPFLCVAKPSTAEKEKGLENFEGKQRDTGRKPENVGSNNPYNRGGLKKKNSHPTVKPIQLYSYLIEIGSVEGEIVLDPFVGSGTTAIAAKTSRRKYIGIEMDEYSAAIAEARLKAVKTIIEHKFWK